MWTRTVGVVWDLLVDVIKDYVELSIEYSIDVDLGELRGNY